MRELTDLRKTNNRRKRSRQPVACYLPRWDRKPRKEDRDRVRRLELLTMGIGNGWLR